MGSHTQWSHQLTIILMWRYKVAEYCLGYRLDMYTRRCQIEDLILRSFNFEKMTRQMVVKLARLYFVIEKSHEQCHLDKKKSGRKRE